MNSNTNIMDSNTNNTNNMDSNTNNINNIDSNTNNTNSDTNNMNSNMNNEKNSKNSTNNNDTDANNVIEKKEKNNDNILGYFSTLDNMHTLYVIQDANKIEMLLSSLVQERKKIKPSNIIVYIVGLALRSMPYNIPEYHKKYLFYLPIPICYGSLWYSNTTEGKECLYYMANHDNLDNNRKKYAKKYSEKIPPQQATDIFFNALVNGIGDKELQHLDELWANWYWCGEENYAKHIVTLTNRDRAIEITKKISSCMCIEAAEVHMKNFCKTQSEIMLYGSLLYDKNLLTILINMFK